jgi:hypothetical protein
LFREAVWWVSTPIRGWNRGRIGEDAGFPDRPDRPGGRGRPAAGEEIDDDEDDWGETRVFLDHPRGRPRPAGREEIGKGEDDEGESRCGGQKGNPVNG